MYVSEIGYDINMTLGGLA